VTPEEFLRAIWPSDGYYALATQFTPQGTTAKLWAHKVFDDPAAAARHAVTTGQNTNVYFAMGSLRERKVWNPLKQNRKDGTQGAFEIRTQANIQSLKCFFLDLDVGESTPTSQKYPSQQAAFADLTRFLGETDLPRPMVVSSGYGLHLYWVLTDAIPSEDWCDHALKLHAIVKHHKLLADPTRVHDRASVLRVLGTLNHKRGQTAPVSLIYPLKTVTPPADFVAKLDDLVIRLDLKVRERKRYLPAGDGWDGNLETEYDGPRVSPKALFEVCPQMRRIAQRRGNVPEPVWYHAINIMRFTSGGRSASHKISLGHPMYNVAETDEKLDQLERVRGEDQRKIGPTSCRKLAEEAGEDYCDGCAFIGKVKGPISAALLKDPAQAPVLVTNTGPTVTTVTLPDPPAPFLRTKDGKIAFTAKAQGGDEMTTIIYENDLFPIRRLTNIQMGTEQQMWRVVLPRGVTHDFTLDADALYDRRKFMSAVAHQGIYPDPANIVYVQDYMVAYIKALQAAADADTQYTHLGWVNEDCKEFILPDKVLLDDGSAKPSMLSLGAQRASSAVHTKGTLAKQVELLRFFKHKAYVNQQIFILAGLGAPLLHATGHHGVIINASGTAGASKSTSLYTAASHWGHPKATTLNGTNDGATTRARNERMTVLANLPVCVDEITKMPVKDAQDLAMNISQPSQRLRLQNDGVERAQVGGLKSTIMLSTANTSLHGMLSAENSAGTAGSMRVVELTFVPLTIHKKFEADLYLRELHENYGHTGPAFMAYVVTHARQIEKRIQQVMREIEEEGQFQQAERFWSGAFAVVIVAAEIALQLGLTSYDPAYIRHYLLNETLPRMRGVVRDEYATPISVLADYLETINSNMVVIGDEWQHQPNLNNVPNVVRKPSGPLLAHYDMPEQRMYVLKKPFKDYCLRVGANSIHVLDALEAFSSDGMGGTAKVVTHKQIKKVLGAGTDLAKAQTWCFMINMAHPDISGVLPSITNAAPATSPPTGKLRRVQ